MTALTNATVSTPYTQVITPSGGISPYTYSIVSGTGSLPTGLYFTPNGAATGATTTIQGTPTGAVGTYAFTFSVSDSYNFSVQKLYTIQLGSPTIIITPGVLPHATVGQLYTQTFVATASVGSYNFTFANTGALPEGLTLTSSTGVLSGTPTRAESNTFTITASNSQYSYSNTTPNYTIVTAASPPTIIVSGSPVNGIWGQVYPGATITASGGTAPYTYKISSGSLPAALTLSSSGAISGTIAKADADDYGSGADGDDIGAYAFTVSATDANGYTGSNSFQISLNNPTITIAAPTSTATVGTAYSSSVSASGGYTPYTYTIASGSLPSGLTKGSSGAITGTPTRNGVYTFTVTATDQYGYSATSSSFTITVGTGTLALSTLSATTGTGNVAYTGTFSASGGSGNYSYAITSGSLPTGITSDGTGTISGTPQATGTFNFTVTATDTTYATTVSRAYTLNIVPPGITVLPTAITSGQFEAAYTQHLAANGGTAPYTFAVTGNHLPQGWQMSTAGVINGTSVGPGWDAYVASQHPNGYQHFQFTVTATDKYGYQGSRAYDHTMKAPTITLSPASSFPATISASGGVEPYIFSVSSGTLPNGWSLNGTTGAISGTDPKTGGTYNWTIQAVDSNGFAGYGNYTVTLSNTNRTYLWLGGGSGYYPWLDQTGSVGTTTGTTTAAGGTTTTYTAAPAAGVQTTPSVAQPTGTSPTTPDPSVTPIPVTPVTTGIVTTQASNTNTACTTTSTTASGTGSSIKVSSGTGTIGMGPTKNYNK